MAKTRRREAGVSDRGETRSASAARASRAANRPVPAAPVEVQAPPPQRSRQVWAIVPCYNRPRDAELLLNDLAGVAAAEPLVELRIVLVDNASDEPLESITAGGAAGGLRVEHLRLDENRGGSGGFNAGIARVLSRGVPCDEGEFIWLLDSDARVEPGTLGPLLYALEQDEELVAVGSALADERGVYEIGGFVNRRTGELLQPARPGSVNGAVAPAEYAAACSLLVRRWAVERAGPMADVFVSGDDVEWCLRLARVTGGRIGVAPASIARHPRPDRMRTWARYYAARNAFVPIGALGLGGRVRFRRAMREVGRALSQTMMGRDDLASLHLRGLADAASGITTGPGRAVAFEKFRPLDQLGPTLKSVLAGQRVRRVRLGRGLGVDQAEIVRHLRRLALEPSVARGEPRPDGGVRAALRGLRRLVIGPPADLAVVSARARPEDWLAGRNLVTVTPEGFVIRRMGRLERLRRVLGVIGRGTGLAIRIARRGVSLAPPAALPAIPETPIHRGTLSIVILSHNRVETLLRTLGQLRADTDRPGKHDARHGLPAVEAVEGEEEGRRRTSRGTRAREIIVVDNASTDGTRDGLAAEFPDARLVMPDSNTGVAGYNLGVEQASGDYILVLDDDSWPDGSALERATRLLDRRPDLAAVVLHPRHPETNASEWAFAETMSPRDDWPLMGCGNLVRREAWLRVGGYEAAFFLYRNDTDLALKLLGAGMKVHFNPGWVVWHESPAAAKKSARWFELATRNWVWLCRRHGRGVTKLAAIAAGWTWAHRRAGVNLRSHWRVLRGAGAGLFRKMPALPETVKPDGKALARVLRMRA